MKLKMGDIISIKHYSGFESFNSIILDCENDNIVIKTPSDFPNENIFVNDPVVIGYSYKREVYICECIVQKINPKEGLTELQIIEEKKITDSRIHERFPVSLFAEINDLETQIPSTVRVRNISVGGIMIISRNNHQIGEIIDLTIYIEDNILKTLGEIVRKNEHEITYEYGIKLIFKNLSSKGIIEKYISYLKNEQLKIVSKLKESL